MKYTPPEKILTWITVKIGGKIRHIPITAAPFKKYGLKVVNPKYLPPGLKRFYASENIVIEPLLPKRMTLTQAKNLRDMLKRVDKVFPGLFKDTTLVFGKTVTEEGKILEFGGIVLGPVVLRDLWKFLKGTQRFLGTEAQRYYAKRSRDLLWNKLQLIKRLRSKRIWIATYPFDTYALYHEPGHILYDRLPAHYRKVWRDHCWVKAADLCPEAKTNPIEGFAEAFRIYMGSKFCVFSPFGKERIRISETLKGPLWFTTKEVEKFITTHKELRQFFDYLASVEWKKYL